MTDVAMTATPVAAAHVVAAPSAASAAVQSTGRRLRRRHLWAIPALAIAIFGNELGTSHGIGIVELILFSVAPDLPRWILPRLGSGARSIAIPLSNVLHHPMVAFAALAVAAAGAANSLIPIVALVATVIWASHIVFGWGFGDGIRQPAPVRPEVAP